MNVLIRRVSLWGAVLGASLLALHISISGWAYIPFLLSNFATIYLLRKSNAPKEIEYQSLFFIVINLIGIVRWLI
jgi:hypothetical protein